MPEAAEILRAVSVWALPVLIAITFHEAAHGWVAWRLGDDTAWRLGRVTFNPLRHVDPFGTIVLPGLMLLLSGGRFMFGFAKPVPVVVARLRHPRWSMVAVAAAGPAANLLLAVVAALLFRLVPYLPQFMAQWTAENLANAVLINLILAVFNLLPLPPLDGGRILVGLLPYRLALPVARLEPFGILIIVGTLFFLPLIGREIGHDLNFIGPVVLAAVRHLAEGIHVLAGLGGG